MSLKWPPPMNDQQLTSQIASEHTAQKWKQKWSLKCQTKQKYNGEVALQHGNPSSLVTLRKSQLSTVHPELVPLSCVPQTADGHRLQKQEHLHSGFPLSCWFVSGLFNYFCTTTCTGRNLSLRYGPVTLHYQGLLSVFAFMQLIVVLGEKQS